MNKYESEVLMKQRFYKENLEKLNKAIDDCKKRGINYNREHIFYYLTYLKGDTLNKSKITEIPYILNTANKDFMFLYENIEFARDDYKIDAKKYLTEVSPISKKLKDDTNLLATEYRNFKKSQGDIFDSIIGEINKNDSYDYEKIPDKSGFSDYDTFGMLNYNELIKEADNTDLKNWYEFLKDLQYSPKKEFTLNKNIICNFKLIFKNPYTKLTTDKENIVQLSHSTSSRKTPVFSIGFQTYKAVSTGVKILAGTMVTAAIENVPLPYLHAISYMNHSSVEDLPPLDLYIVPIENINDDGRYEVLLIKGIQFTEMKQNDNASSTGVYYAFSYFAEDVIPLDFSTARKYYDISY